MSQYIQTLHNASVKYILNNNNNHNNSTYYGEILSEYDPNKDEMYTEFVHYFNDPVMTKIKDVNGFSMYMTKTYCLLSTECRYIISFILEDGMPTGSQEKLSNLKWTSLQTRTLSDKYSLPSHAYQPKRNGKLNTPITRVNVENETSIYKSEKYPITVTLLHTKNNNSNYQNNGNIVSAIETYQTIITCN